MCLAIPMQVLRIQGDRAIAMIDGVEREVGIVMVPDVVAGEYVIVHAGFAIQKLSEQEAQETLALFEKMASYEEDKELNL